MDALETKTWDIDDFLADGECSPLEFIIGHIQGKWVADEESLYGAIVAIMAATFAEAGMDPDVAVDVAMAQAERVTSASWDGTSLEFRMDDEDAAEPI